MQMGLALLTYIDANNVLPPGYFDPLSGLNFGLCWGLSALLLPNFELWNLSRNLDMNVHAIGNGVNPVTPTSLTQMTISVFTCPSDTGPRVNPYYDNHAKSSYRGVAGSLLPMVPIAGGLGLPN